MSNRFLNDHKVRKVIVSKILKITAGGLHCWCDSNVGIIKKPNNDISDYLWDAFFNRKPKFGTISAKTIEVDLSKPLPKIPLFPDIEIGKPVKSNLKWWQKILDWFTGFFLKK